MKTKQILNYTMGILAGAFLVAGCTTSKGAKNAPPTESMLRAAGFRVVQATTPEQIQQVNSMPAGRFSIVQRNSVTYHVYPVKAKNLLYAGKDEQYMAYVRFRTDWEEDQQYDEISRRDPGVAKYNNETEALSGTAPVDWDWNWDAWDKKK